MDLMVHYLPDGAQPTATLSKRARLFDCQQATFALAPPTHDFSADWTPLERPYSSSFLKCLSDTEITKWSDDMTTGQVRSLVKTQVGIEVHYWYSLKSDHLMIMLLET